MVEILNVILDNDGVIVEFLSNNIKISEKDFEATNHTPEEIISEIYNNKLKEHITQECIARGIDNPDHELPSVIDEVVNIELFSVNNYTFFEGNQAIEQPLRCTGYTKFGKVVDLRNKTTFVIDEIIEGLSVNDNIFFICPISTCQGHITATYKGMTSVKSFDITYVSKAEIDERNNQSLQEIEIQKKIIRKNEIQNEIEILKNRLTETDYMVIKCYEYQLASMELPYNISELHANRQTIRDSINSLEEEERRLIDG